MAILEATNTGATKTHIMFSANLSFKLLEKYLQVVSTAGLVKFENSNYTLTAFGRTLLKRYQSYTERYNQAQSLLSSLEIEHEKLSRLVEKPRLGPSAGAFPQTG